MSQWFAALFGHAAPVVETAAHNDARALARLHQASFHRGWSEDEFSGMFRERNILAHRLRRRREVIGFAISRIAADEAELLSIAISPHDRGGGFSRDLLATHLGHLAGQGVRTVFLEVEEANEPALRLYARFDFRAVGRRERYYREAGGIERHAVVMRRDLS